MSSSTGVIATEKRQRSLGYWLNAWIPVVLGMGVIGLESTMMMGADHTSAPLRWLYEHIFGHVSSASWNSIHYLIRKTGHFTGYGLISLAWLRAWHRTLPRVRFIADALLALFGTALLASWDEWHQSLLPNRTSSSEDVLVDCCGAIFMVLIVRIIAGRRFMPAK